MDTHGSRPKMAGLVEVMLAPGFSKQCIPSKINLHTHIRLKNGQSYTYTLASP